MKRLDISPVQVIAHFLAEVRNFTVKSIEQSFLMKQIPIETIITIPAIWDDKAKDLMVQAAVQAGYGVHRLDFHFISEPEAAAAYALKKNDGDDLHLGDSFVICDAGGGTVDLVSYQITGKNPIQINEVVRGSGGMCGSVYLDQRFEQHMRQLLGDEDFKMMKPYAKEQMMRSWEDSVKPAFGNCAENGDPYEEEYLITLNGVPDCKDKNIDDGVYIMSG